MTKYAKGRNTSRKVAKEGREDYNHISWLRRAVPGSPAPKENREIQKETKENAMDLLGIVKCRFELGTGQENFRWAE